MTTCRFCGEMVLTKPEKLVSIESMAIMGFLEETDIDIDERNNHKLICKQCEVTAKGYAAFINKIKRTQMKFRIKKKRPVPNIIAADDAINKQDDVNNNIKRAKQEAENEFVRMVGECTMTRIVKNAEKEEKIIQEMEDDDDDDYDDFDNYPFIDRGESSQSLSCYEGSWTCFDCGEIFVDGKLFVLHLESCLKDPICPLCGLVCAAHNLLSMHLLHAHDLAVC